MMLVPGTLYHLVQLTNYFGYAVGNALLVQRRMFVGVTLCSAKSGQVLEFFAGHGLFQGPIEPVSHKADKDAQVVSVPAGGGVCQAVGR